MKILTVIFLLSILSNHSISQPVWNFQNSDTTSNLNEIFLISPYSRPTLFIAGDNGTILRSTNLGLIWETINSNTTSDLYSIAIVDNGIGYAVGSGGTIIKTIDSGNTWTNVLSNTLNDLKDVKLSFGTTGIAVGDNGTLLKLEDNIWTASQIDTVDFNSTAYGSFSPDFFLIVGNRGTLMRTTDRGLNWQRLNTGTLNNLNYISTYDNIIAGDGGIRLRINGNNVYLFQTPTMNNLLGMVNYNYTTVISGANGTVLRNDQLVNTNVAVDLNSIMQTKYDNCFVAGDNGTILFTNTFYWSSGFKQLDANNISTWFKNDGVFNRHPISQGGFEWPKGENKYVVFSSGSVIGAIVAGDSLVTVCEYNSEYFPGYTDNSGIPHGNGNAEYKI
ncbi:MAG: hypothetical protein ABI462_13490, partial [Ignavibacteria bacterium]